MTVAEALRNAAGKIDRFEAQYLLAHVLGLSRASLIAHPEQELDARELSIYEAQVTARGRGRPVAYILGRREFYGREFAVNEDVLIPRPETETLVTEALKRIDGSQAVLDLGTGSGNIAVTLKLEAPAASVSAVEKSPRALALARQNAEALRAELRFFQSDWFSALAGERFHVIASNPPYVALGDAHLDQGDLRFEPEGALTDGVTGAAGLACIRVIVEEAPRHLHAGGWLLFEHGWDQAEACRALLVERGFSEVASVADLAGIERVAVGRWQH